jgi:hypothetical protein
MIWHIFRKDARLLWPMAALVAALNVCAAVPYRLIDHGIRNSQLGILGTLLPALALLSVIVVVVVAMHQDAIPGARQDWLIRPIRRVDMALAKLLFVLLMVQLPLWMVDVGTALADGFALPAASVAAAARNIQIFCEFALPAMMIGAITRTFVEAFVVAVGGFVLYVGIFLVGLSMLLGMKGTVGETGSAWMFTAAFDILALIGIAVILALQYLGRRTTLARWVVGVGGALAICVMHLPWPVAFRMQAALSPDPTAARAITVGFDPQAGRYRLPAGAAPAVTSALHLPLRVSDVPDDSSVLMDRADVRIMGLDGTTLYQGKSTISFDGRGSTLDGRFEVRAGHGDGPVHSIDERIYLPDDVYARLSDRPVRMSIDYSLTLFGASGTYSLAATGARQSLPGLGLCSTGIDAEGDDVEVGCLSTAQQPTCISVYLEHPATGLRNPETHVCNPDYTPALIGQFWPDTIHRMGGEVRFFDRTGMVRFPVDGSKLAAARLIIKTYHARDHFTRHIDTPIVKLADLTGLAAQSVASR